MHVCERKQEIQNNSFLFFFFIGSLFRRGMPLLKTAFRKGSSLAKKAASSDLAKSIGNTVGATATDIAATAASDLIAGRDLGDLKSKSTAKLTKARKQIADLIKPVDEKKKRKKKTKRRTQQDSDSEGDIDFDDDDDEDDDDEELSPPPPPKRSKKKKVTATKAKGRKKQIYSVFDI